MGFLWFLLGFVVGVLWLLLGAVVAFSRGGPGDGPEDA
jgi:hypothetical protein